MTAGIALAAAACGESCDEDDKITDPLTLQTASSIVKQSSDPQTRPLGGQVTLAVKVLSANLSPFKGGVVSWGATPPNAGGSFTPISATSGDDGVAATVWNPPAAPGTYQAKAFLYNTSSNQTFTVVVEPDVATSIIKQAGDGATRSAGGQVTLAVKVLSNQNTAFPGATVNWTTGTGLVFPPSSLSGADGIATTSWTLPATAGTGYQATASLGSISTQVFTGSVSACYNPMVIADDFSTDVGGGWSVTPTTTNQNFTQSAVYQTTGGNAGGSGTNPGGYRRMQHVENGAGTISVYHLREIEYDPSLPGNEIDHINYSEDQIEFLPPFQNAAVGWGFLFEQGGTRYIKSIGNAAYANLSWLTAGIPAMTAADWVGENFGSGGGKIKFGFYRANTNDGSGTITVTHGIDNFRVEICRKSP